MSYNIDRCAYLNGKLSLNVGIARELLHTYMMAECTFFEDMDLETKRDRDNVVIDCPEWSGEFSGLYYDVYLKILSCTSGCAEILVVWEDGDTYSGLRVENGIVLEKEVVHTLKD